MILLPDLIALGEKRLENRVFNFIRESSFYKYIPFKEEKWLQLISGLSASFRSALQVEGRLSQFSSYDDYINPAIIMIIFKYYRQAVLEELLLDSDLDKSLQHHYRDITERLLESMEISYCEDQIILSEIKAEGLKAVNSNVEMHGSMEILPELREAETETPEFKGKILIVEDDPVLRKLTLLQIQKLGYIARAVSSGREAMDEVLPYDLVLMDLQMPNMDGFQATRSIREREQQLGCHVPIIALTSHAMKDNREQCLSAGMDDYLSKPVKLCQLKQTISRWIVPKEKNKENSVYVPMDELNFQEAVNLNTLKNLRHLQADVGSDLLIKELIDIYLTDTPPRLAALILAEEQSEAEALSFASHTLKSSSANIGALRLSIMAGELELLGRNDCLEEADVMISQITSEYEKVRSELLQIRATLKA